MLATDLSDTEVVLGKLGAADAGPGSAGVFATGPCDQHAAGRDRPVRAGVAFAVIAAVAVFGCTFALALSVWARKPHEVVLAVYMSWALSLLAYPIGQGIGRFDAGFFQPLEWLLLANPFYLAFRPICARQHVDWWEFAEFFAATLGSSAVLAVTIRTTRASAIRSRGRVETVPGSESLRGRPLATRTLHRPEPGLVASGIDRDRPGAVLLGVLIAMTTASCSLEAFVIWNDGVDRAR